MKRKLNLIELNEINFDIIKLYVNANPQQFPVFRRFFSKEFRRSQRNDTNSLNLDTVGIGSHRKSYQT